MGTNELLGDNLTKCWEVTCDGLVSHPGGVEILQSLHTTETGDKCRPDGPPGSPQFRLGADFYFFKQLQCQYVKVPGLP